MIIVKDDIIAVAASINVSLTESELDWVLLCYEDAQRQDPSGTWNLIVEDLIQQAVEFRQNHEEFGEDASTDDCFFDYENDIRPYHSDGDGGDDVNLNFMG